MCERSLQSNSGNVAGSVAALQDLAEILRFMGSPLSKIHTLCAHYPRIAEFIPPQGQNIQEHRNNSNAFANSSPKRHECRAPLARLLGRENRQNPDTYQDYESDPRQEGAPYPRALCNFEHGMITAKPELSVGGKLTN